MFMLHQAMDNDGQARAFVHECLLDATNAEQDTHTLGHAIKLGVSDSHTSTALVIVEPEDSTILDWQVLIRVPGRCTERLQATVTGETLPGGDVEGSIDFVGEGEVRVVLLGSGFVSLVFGKSARGKHTFAAKEAANLLSLLLVIVKLIIIVLLVILSFIQLNLFRLLVVLGPAETLSDSTKVVTLL